MKRKKIEKLFEYSIVCVLILSLSGCSMALEQGSKPKVNDDELKSSVAQIIDEQLDVVGPYIEDDATTKSIVDYENITGAEVVEGVLKEESGHAYLEFAYDTAYNSEDNLDEFVAESKKLMPEKEAQELDEKIDEAKKAIYSEFEDLGRAVPPSQQIAFQKDLRKLVTRSLVLFVAGVVYTFLPKTMIWGKISAAAAISVATGVLSVTIMSLYQYYKYGGDPDESFEQWLEEVTTQPQISYALASSMITVGTTMKRSPVITGLTICVFSLYKVIDMVKPMLKKYNFNV
jgi:hypothetical protein